MQNILIKDISKKLSLLKKYPFILKKICRGVERETLRINDNGKISTKFHPCSLGFSLYHKFITTDFSESLLELITPKNKNINFTISFLKDIHKYVVKNIDNEYLWPFSMPCYISNIEDIKLAKYGDSPLGKKKKTYRKGLRNRYGTLMNIISGVHYNFSLPLVFWEKIKKKNNKLTGKELANNGYLKMMRNYLRFGWIIPYLFGSSPGICSSYLKEKKTNLNLLKHKNTLYLPWATSLRMSELGYHDNIQPEINISFNNLQDYIKNINYALNTSSKIFSKKNKENKNIQQLNTNILQMENELYIKIRPKRETYNNESLLDSLSEKGIEYVEIRSLDINPFSPIGIDKTQIMFLDLFLIWCSLVDSPRMNNKELKLSYKNWNKIILEGRKPNQKIKINHNFKNSFYLKKIIKHIFNDLFNIAKIIDVKNNNYQKTCKKLFICSYCPEMTLSGKMLKYMLKYGFIDWGLKLSKKYYNYLNNKKINKKNKKIIIKETKRSRNILNK
ncbi:glutamate--cysteine ligase [Buchnera aphidicola (Taiwanaphis decaspermi)]|uniref:glutamate--cysteine ligase n=1 Tax=Buchnera aphidicola TaxID=9 RepID=UPI0031B80327